MSEQQTCEPDQARRDWITALAAVHAELPAIPHDATANTGVYSYRYTSLPALLRICGPLLARHGLVVWYRQSITQDRVDVTAILSHVAGHQEESTVSLPIIASQRQPAQHTVAGLITYGRRYAMCSVTGVVMGDEDLDGATEAPTATKHTESHYSTKTPVILRNSERPSGDPSITPAAMAPGPPALADEIRAAAVELAQRTGSTVEEVLRKHSRFTGKDGSAHDFGCDDLDRLAEQRPKWLISTAGRMKETLGKPGG